MTTVRMKCPNCASLDLFKPQAEADGTLLICRSCGKRIKNDDLKKLPEVIGAVEAIKNRLLRLFR